MRRKASASANSAINISSESSEPSSEIAVRAAAADQLSALAIQRRPATDAAQFRQEREARKFYRAHKILALEASKTIVKSTSACCLATSLQAQRRSSIGSDAASLQLHERLSDLLAKLHSCCVAETALLDARLQEDIVQCAQQLEQQQLATRIATLSLQAERDSAGSVQLKRLSAAHPQHVRCRRAAAENTKADFFTSSSSYCCIDVLDVYKLEHAALAQQFQAAASADGAEAKVKGLFCLIPSASLERLVLHGFAADSTAAATTVAAASQPSDSLTVPGALADIALHDSSSSSQQRRSSRLQSVAERSAAVPFPCAFSRHSTLEQDRSLVSTATAAAAATDTAVHSSRTPQIRLLALCRVLTGKILVTDNDHSSSSSNSSSSSRETVGFDCSYSPLSEQYSVFSPARALPEFIIAVRYKARDSAAVAAMHNSSQAQLSAALRHSRAVDSRSDTTITTAAAAAAVSLDNDTSQAGDATATAAATAAAAVGSTTSANDAESWERARSKQVAQRALLTRAVEAAFARHKQQLREVQRTVYGP
jgi:hypothetical protein